MSQAWLLSADWIVDFQLVRRLELLVVAMAVAMGWLAPRIGSACSTRLRRPSRWLAARPAAAVAAVGLLAAAGSILVALVVRFPEPDVQDEFSCLLAADTFASGRLTNPTHPLWHHFESFHIFHEPTYQSKYPPGQALVLALGQALAGHPIVGVWLSIGLFVGSTCWMLQAWHPARWAFIGGVLAALHFGFFGYWSQSYWGGAVAATGGALVYGSLRRIMRRPAVGLAVVLAVGLLLLANTRPLEGLVASLPAAAVLGGWLFAERGRRFTARVCRVGLPIGLVLAAGGAWMAYYNFRVTGSPWKLPYQAHEEHYAFIPVVLWKPLGKPMQYRHETFYDFYDGWMRADFTYKRTPAGFVAAKRFESLTLFRFFVPVAFWLPLLMAPGILRNRWQRLALLVIGLTWLATLSATWPAHRMFAPAAPLVWAFAIDGMRRLRRVRVGDRPMGRFLVRTIPLICVTTVLVSFVPNFWYEPRPHVYQRARMLRQLAGDGNQHLVVVRYAADHNVHHEWVYNRADIDAAPVVWARDMGEPANRRLRDYFKGRKVWLLEPDRDPVRLIPYQPANGREGASRPRTATSFSSLANDRNRLGGALFGPQRPDRSPGVRSCVAAGSIRNPPPTLRGRQPILLFTGEYPHRAASFASGAAEG